jgi:S-DNA-T family DNA segregation ATPase FtsK/SpoIIIE
LAQATRKRTEKSLAASRVGQGLREAALWIFAGVAIIVFAALVTYSPSDPGFTDSGTTRGHVANYVGPAGAWLSDLLFFLFGYPAYVFPLLIAYAGWMVYRQGGGRPANALSLSLQGVGLLLTLAAVSGLAALHWPKHASLPVGAGGALGELVSHELLITFGFLGTTLLLLAIFLGAVTLFTGLSWLAMMDWVGAFCLGLGERLVSRWRWAIESLNARRERKRAARAALKVEQPAKPKRKRAKPRIEPVIKAPVIKTAEPSPRVERERQVPLFKPASSSELPPLSLLDKPPARQAGYSKEALEAMSRQVELKLKDFGVVVEVVAVSPGPVVTRFELQPAPGVKVSQISNLAKDLARALSVISVRVVEIIPGKSVVGLEIPNENRELVTLGEILASEGYDEPSSPLTLALGKDIGGHPVVANLQRMPHLLIAGTTGAGKSVAINAMILSLVYKASAEQARLILIDPKMLELSVYEGIPHLLAPVVTDMKDAANALRWCVAEMERRYRLMAALGVRNLANFNRKVQEAIDKGEPITDPLQEKSDDLLASEDEPPTLTAMPYIVVVIDELADMMLVVGKKVEELIARLAQKARASGIHLILATQRPSVDVITGLIKANIPSRIAFQVSARVDSRTILDQMGAEALLGHGDMLYLPPGTGMPLRVHGAFVSDQEVHRVAENLKSGGNAQYLDEVLEGTTEAIPGIAGPSGGGDEEADPLYDQAVRVVTETRKASISGVQRRLKVGYNRAARMVEQMEESGLVGPLQSNGAREVLAAPPPDD